MGVVVDTYSRVIHSTADISEDGNIDNQSNAE